MLNVYAKAWFDFVGGGLFGVTEGLVKTAPSGCFAGGHRHSPSANESNGMASILTGPPAMGKPMNGGGKAKPGLGFWAIFAHSPDVERLRQGLHHLDQPLAIGQGADSDANVFRKAEGGAIAHEHTLAGELAAI